MRSKRQINKLLREAPCPAETPSWKESAICDKCGEAAHVTFCPKPPTIPKKEWQKMNDDQRLEAEI
jgi:hypothetical protein